MSFLTPLYLAGLLTVSLPVLFHMFRRTPKGRLPFSTIMFLQPSPPRITRRNRVEHWPLLLLRALALCLLAAVFARPFFRQTAATGTDAPAEQQVALLLDTSASMRRGDLWQQAMTRLERPLKSVGSQDRIGVFTFDRQLHTVLSFEEWSSLQPESRRKLLKQRLQAVKPGWGETDLGRALVDAAEQLQSQTAGGADSDRRLQRVLCVFTDLQTGSHLDALQSYNWPKDVTVRLERVQTSATTNAGLHLLDDGAGVSSTDNGRRLRVQIINAADSTREQFRLRCVVENSQQTPIDPIDVYVPPGTSRVVHVPVPKIPSAATVRLSLQGDDHEFDNTVVVHQSAPAKWTVLYVGSDSPDDPRGLRYYLERAFRSDSRQQVSVLVDEADAPLLSPAGHDVRLVVVTEPPADAHFSALHRFAQDGGTILAVAKTAADCSMFGQLLGENALPAAEADVDGYAMLTEVDYSHPLFAPFAEPDFSDFTKIHFWKHRTVQLDDVPLSRVLARFDDGDPALIETPVGTGRILLFTAGWQPADSQLARSSKFAPLLNGILRSAAPDADVFRRYTVGDAVPLAQSDRRSSAATVIRLPDERTIQLASGEGAFSETVVPGIYTVASAPGRPRFSVSLAPDESKTSPMPIEQLEALGVPLHVPQDKPTVKQAETRRRQLQRRELENRQKLWRWLLAAAIALLFAETWLAGRMAGRRSPSPDGTVNPTDSPPSSPVPPGRRDRQKETAQ